MAEIEMLEGVRQAPRGEWNDLVADESPFLEWDWLAALEESGAVSTETGWTPLPLVAREEGKLVAACPLYVKQHSEGEFVFDWSWADAAYRAGIDYYPKLLVGVPFTPVTGARFLTASCVDRSVWVGRLAQTVREICSSNDLSGAHVNFCRDDERAPLESAGFMPRLGFQYHWKNDGFRSFDDYLASLRSKRRNQVRRERREMESQEISIERHVGAAIPDDLFQRVFEIYRVTIDKNPWGRLYLNRRFFDLLGERFRERLCLIVARQRGEIIAGALNVQKGDSLYGRYWGAFRELRHLHFNICYYAGVEHCIEAGLARFEPGAGGQYKQMRGFDAAPTWSFHFLTDPRLSSAVKRFLDGERAEARHAIDWYTGHTARKRGTTGAG
jgi:predicted N-acyltransferase